ncbi:hypothetical protein FHS31_000269 [Sphingomonas vulcanisoli]|uniref:Peptidase C14 caspase domain-containing protein n=1 Tax=Sphingomonas vulcanisoli TaxID=1658060 RepID=A0ABX0TQM2_9SPHN|nr:caspase family protein [Sphingomonas vulcanisoli]NIJ06687.1 hypothetical protein [Sphingomonas vulcanisoli]
MALLLLVLAPTFAKARTVRMLFVGIDHYQYSGLETAEFKDLQGPVSDVALIKTTLHKAVGLDVEGRVEPADPRCPGPSRTAITLVDAQATRTAILGALTGQICRARSGDIVLFYYAGHGSTYLDQSGTKAGGRSDTILAYDSRKLGGDPDILDTELRAIIAAASKKGVSVVTIFDSCHSGTATRALAQGNSRAVPPGPPAAIDPAVRASLGNALAQMDANDVVVADGRAYRVHLAAAKDSETAHEYLYGKTWHGAFTLALAAQIARRPAATYGDLARATQLALDDRANAKQHPQAEGALLATFLGSDPGTTRIYAGTRISARQTRIDGGLLSGVSVGSVFAIYADTTSAVAAGTPLGRGAVTSIDAETALLDVTGDLAKRLPAVVALRELQHRYGADGLGVLLRLDDPRAARIATKALEGSGGLMKPASDHADLIVASTNGQVALCDSDGRFLEALGSSADPLFADRMATAAQIIARFQSMLALRNDEGPKRVSLAVTRNCDDRADIACADLPTDDGEPQFHTGERFRVTATNETAQDQYVYLFDLEPDRYSVTPFQPGGANDLLPAKKDVSFAGTAGLPGRAHLLLIATPRPIDMSMLAQEGLSRDLNPLAKLLQAAENGTRAVDTPQVGDWGATLVTLRVVDSSRPLPEPPSPCATYASSAAPHSR